MSAVGIGNCGVVGDYPLTWLAIAFSGVGTAAYDPGAARMASVVTAGRTRGMSIFSTGGNVGFTLGPLISAPLILSWGLRATPLLAIPGLAMAGGVLPLLRSASRATQAGPAGSRPTSAGRDQWKGFARVTFAVITRSAAFFGIAAFAPLYWRGDLGASTALSEIALTCFLGSGVVGALLGGAIADGQGRWRTVRAGNVLLVPALLLLVLASPVMGPVFSLPLLVLVGVSLQMPHSVLVVLGQDYLPNRTGTAAGVTLGLAMTAGGLVAPGLGVFADHFGPRFVLVMMVAFPVAALAVALRTRDPRPGIPVDMPAARPAAALATYTSPA
jgi:FSR family fosmidomycin resistance protein-like MFS transporter